MQLAFGSQYKTKLFFILLIPWSVLMVYLTVSPWPSGRPSQDSLSSNVITRETLQRNLVMESDVKKDTDIFFAPNNIKFNDSNSAQTDIIVNTHSNKITVLQLEMLFDPSQILSVDIEKPDAYSLFGDSSEYVVLFQGVDKKNGRISYTVGVKPGGTPKQGIGNVLHLVIRPNKPTTEGLSKLSFTENTQAVEQGKRSSVINTVTPLFTYF